MNFLAHLWLADRSRTSLAGAILGDVVRGADLSHLDPALATGVRLHRRIDACFDQHPLVQAEKGCYGPGRRRYAGIVIDVVCDHALALQWPNFSSETLEGFCARAAAAVAAEAQAFLQAGARPPEKTAFAQLLSSYARPAGVERSLSRVATRLSRPADFAAAAEEWPSTLQRLQPLLPMLLADLLAELELAQGQGLRPSGD